MTDKQAAIEAARKAIEGVAWSGGEYEPLNAHDDALQLATAAIRAYLEARAAQGVVEAPEVPSKEMLLAGSEAVPTHDATDIWDAMIAARPRQEDGFRDGDIVWPSGEVWRGEE